MNIREHFTIDAMGFTVLFICIIGVGAVLVDFFWIAERGTLNIEAIFLNFAFGGLVLNRILPVPDNLSLARLRVLRLVSEVLFAIAVLVVIVWWVFYGIWFNFFPILMAPSSTLAVYLLINYGFKPNDREGKSPP